MDNTITDKNKDDLVKCVASFHDQLKQESERGSVIVGSALISDALEDLLKAMMIKSINTDDELFNGAYAPLDNFSAKIDLAYRLGLIPLNLRKSLHHIRKLRNDFAHSSLQINFKTQSVHDKIRTLFDLNKELLDFIWHIIKDNYKDLMDNDDSKHGIDYLVEIDGWKSTFELLISIIAASLCIRKNKVPQLQSYK